MLKLIFTLFSFSFILFGFSQTSGVLSIQLPASSPNLLAEPFQGQHFKVKSDNDIEGNPLLFNDWKSGDVTLKNNEKYHVEKINLDALRHKFIYYKNDTMYEFFDNIKEIRIYNENHLDDPGSDMVFRGDINPISANFVQVLAKGKITVFQEYDKKPEGENYSNGIVNNTRKYVLHTNLNALVNNKVIPIKFNSSTLEELTSDKRIQMDAYLKENKLKAKKENDFLKAIMYYNSISSSTH